MREVYQNEEEANVVDDTLEAMVREGARRMLAAALEEEVSGFLGRDRYERGEEFRGYRNGYHRSRELTVGVSAVEVKAPRVRDVPAEVAGGGFESKIVRRYERTSRQTQDLFRKWYLEGLSTGDFEPVFRELVRCAEELEGSGSECAAIGGGRRCAGVVGCAGCGVSDCGSSEVLEPPCAERAEQVAEGAEL